MGMTALQKNWMWGIPISLKLQNIRDGHEREDEGYSCLSMIIDLLQSTHVLSYQPDGLSVAIGRAKVATWKYLQAVILM